MKAPIFPLKKKKSHLKSTSYFPTMDISVDVVLLFSILCSIFGVKFSKRDKEFPHEYFLTGDMTWTENGTKVASPWLGPPFLFVWTQAIPLIIVSRTVGALALSPPSSGIGQHRAAVFDQERGVWTLCAPDCAQFHLLSAEVSAKSLTLAAN